MTSSPRADDIADCIVGADLFHVEGVVDLVPRLLGCSRWQRRGRHRRRGLGLRQAFTYTCDNEALSWCVALQARKTVAE